MAVLNFAPYFGLCHDHLRPWRRPVIAAAVVGCALIAAGCGGSSSAGAAGKSGSASAGAAGKSGSAAASQLPDQVIAAAAARMSTITSAAATITENVGHGQEDISGSLQEKLKPTLRISTTLKLSVSGRSAAIGMVVSDQAIWAKIADFQQETGKPWVRIPFSALTKTGVGAAAVFKILQNLSPAQQTAWLAGARHVRESGTLAINGVPTTEYSGSVVPAEASAKMTPALRKALAPGLQTISGDIRFSDWIDGSGYIRQQVVHEIASGRQVSIIILFTAINQPVHITMPPASQTAALPSSALGTAS
jgi:hypothetical protein